MNIKEFEYQCTNQIIFTHDLQKTLQQARDRLNVQKAFVCTDAGMSKLDHYHRFLTAMENVGFPYVEFHGVELNPDDKSVDAAAEALRKTDCDCVIGFGGGSSLDTAKTIAAIRTNGGSVRDYFGVNALHTEPLPIIAIPTTAGSGADITYFASVVDSEKQTKAQVLDPRIAPDISLSYPENLLGMPKPLIPAVGFDALTHAVEGYINAKANPITETLSLKSFELLSQNLVRFYNDSNDLEAASAMLIATSLGCMACTSIGTGDAHCIGRSVGGKYHGIHHGTALGVSLPHVLNFNLEVRTEKLADLARSMGLEVLGKTSREAAQMVILAIQQIRDDLGMPSSYKELGMNLADLDELAAATKDKGERGSSAGAPPRKGTIEEYKQLITDCYYGKKICY